jgi:F-type H+-transporting ATPase subunit alpha
MENIRPAEVSELLKKQIEGFTTNTNLEEVGTVLQVGDGIARVYGLQNVRANELVEFETCKGVVLNLEQDNVGVVLLGSSNNIKEGEIVKRTGRIASVKVGDGMLGRVINTNGEPLTEKDPLKVMCTNFH